MGRNRGMEHNDGCLAMTLSHACLRSFVHRINALAIVHVNKPFLLTSAMLSLSPSFLPSTPRYDMP